MSFFISKDDLKKEGTSLLFKLRDELKQFQDMFRTNFSYSFLK